MQRCDIDDGAVEAASVDPWIHLHPTGLISYGAPSGFSFSYTDMFCEINKHTGWVNPSICIARVTGFCGLHQPRILRLPETCTQYECTEPPWKHDVLATSL